MNEFDFSSIDVNEFLNYLVECGKVDAVDTQMQIERMKNEKYLNMHNHKIWQREDGKWNTYLEDENSPRGYSLKVRKSKEEIEKLICKFYKDKECKSQYLNVQKTENINVQISATPLTEFPEKLAFP